MVYAIFTFFATLSCNLPLAPLSQPPGEEHGRDESPHGGEQPAVDLADHRHRAREVRAEGVADPNEQGTPDCGARRVVSEKSAEAHARGSGDGWHQVLDARNET